jgi:deoxycytidylate deaminase
MNNYQINWSDIVFGSKKSLRDLNATFMPAPREMSIKRFTQIIKQYLPSGNIVIGCNNEDYVDGFDGQPQFKLLKVETISDVISKVNKSNSPHKITVFQYRESDILNIYEKIKFKRILLVNGSWQYSFHLRPEYNALVSKNIPFEFISPFVDENEAIAYAAKFQSVMPLRTDPVNELDILLFAGDFAKQSFANEQQTGVVIAEKVGDKYRPLAAAYNKTEPYLTFAWHFGALRERHLSPPGDLNYYDTAHAEIMLLVQSQKLGLKLTNTSLFINLLPCPTCARMLCETDIDEVVYSLDHSEGYAVALLEKAGKKVRRLIDSDKILKTEG